MRVTLSLVFLVGSVGQALAQRPSSPDVVVLADGSMFRGTIAELVVDDHVVIQTLTGEVRRFEMSDVTYAGPEDAHPSSESSTAPSQAPPPDETSPAELPPEPQAEVLPATPAMVDLDMGVPVTFESAHRDEPLTVFRSGSRIAASAVLTAREYNEVCTTPCVANIPRGRHKFTVTHAGESDYRYLDSIEIGGGAPRFTVQYGSSGGARAGAYTLIGVGVAAFALLVVSAVGWNPFHAHPNEDFVLPFLGSLVGTAATLTPGIMLALDLESTKIVPAEQAGN